MDASNYQIAEMNQKMQAYLTSFEHIPYGIAIVKNDSSSTIIQANSAYYQIIGYTENELLEKHGNRIADILIDNVYNVVEQQSTKDDYNIEWDLRIRAADGSIRWIHDFAHYDAEYDVFFITITDVTDKMIVPIVHLSFDAFQTRNAILPYVSKYTTEHIIVTDFVTDEIVYMNHSAINLLGFKEESDWLGKPYFEIAFGAKEDVPASYYETLSEDKFTGGDFYNEFHKMHCNVKSKIITVPRLNRKMRFNIITDITAQKQLEQRMAMRTALHSGMEALFTAGVADKSPEEAYYDILNQLKAFYLADSAFFYKFADKTNEVEAVYKALPNDVNISNLNFSIKASDEQMQFLHAVSSANDSSDMESILSTFKDIYKATLLDLRVDYKIDTFSCVTIKSAEGKIVAFMGVANPQCNQDDKELMELLSRFVFMFIEHKQDEIIKEEALALEAASKASLVEKCLKNSEDVTHSSESIADTLDALCLHYDADFAVALLNQADGSCITSYVGGAAIPDLAGLDNQPRNIMDSWVEIFKTYPEIASDVDFVDSTALLVKKILHEKFGIYNFIVSPIKDTNDAIVGLLFVNNFKLLNRARLMVHVVAESISSYLAKIKLYESTQLGLLTRLAHKTTVQSQISKLLEKGKNGTLFIIDIDNFKQLNDNFGHHIGDQAIVDVADNLKQIFESTDVVGRIGGDEFLVFCPGLVSHDDITAKANQILAKCYHHYEKDGLSTIVSASIGICLVDNKCKTFQPLYENADYALYIAKKRGKHRYYIYTDAEYLENTSATDELRFYPSVVEKLQTAIHDNAFVVHYQPLHHIPTGTFTQAEALLRMRNRDGTLIYPNDFIQVAENSGLVVEMTYQVLEQVCRDFRQILTDHPDTTLSSIAINVPYLQFTDPNMENRFVEILNKYDISANQIKLEITERTIIADMDLMLKKMSSMIELGFDFELDDFGTDYSNLQTSITLPLNVIKLDRSLLLAASSTEVGHHFFSHILSGLHESGRHTVMEGVETQEQLDWATACNCDYIQGYYFSKPLEFKRFSELLHA